MRWLARRLVFYVFAIWVALTLNFLLPRLMPGDPMAGVLQHLSPSQISSNPGIIQTYQALLGGGHHSIWQDYVTYMHRIAHFDFGISTSNYPTHVSEVIGRTLPYSIFLVGVAFLLAFFIGTVVGMVAAWRRGGVVDSVLVPAFMAIGAFPAFFTALLGLWLLGLELHWFPIQHAYDNSVTPGLNWAFLTSALRHSELPILVVVGAYAGGWVLNMRTVMINTISEDYVAAATRSCRRSTASPRCSRAPSAASFSSSTSSAIRAPVTRSSRRYSATTTRSRRRSSWCWPSA